MLITHNMLITLFNTTNKLFIVIVLITKNIKTGNVSSTAADDTTAGGASLDSAYGITNLNKGGLIKRRKKK